MSSGIGYDWDLVGHDGVSRHASDFVAGDFGKPQRAVRPGRNTTGAAKPGRNTGAASPGEFGNGSARGDAADAAAVARYPTSVNQTFPSGPSEIGNGPLFDAGIENSVTG